MVRIKDADVQPFEREHIRKVREYAPGCTLFLKRDGSFPLNAPCDIAAYGRGVRKTVKGGTGSGDVNVRHFVTVEEGLENAGFTIITKQWLETYDSVYGAAQKSFYDSLCAEAQARGVSPMLYGMGKIMPEPECALDLEHPGGTAAIYVLSRTSGEGADRTVKKGDVALTDVEVRDILALNDTYRSFMLVLNVGGMVDLRPVQQVRNILLLGQLGSVTGDVLADILLGKAFPSGKLTMSWAPPEDYPCARDFGAPDDTVYREGIYVGYRYFDTAEREVLFPFGFGLGYTEFQIDMQDVRLLGANVTVTAQVTNTGEYPGREVVQVYVSAPGGALARSAQELAGVGKTALLMPGESESIAVTFAMEDMAAYSEKDASYLLEAGDYIVRLGNSSRNNSPCAVIELKQTVMTRKVKNICIGERPSGEMRLAAQRVSCTGLPRCTLHADAFRTQTVLYSARPQGDTGTPVQWRAVLSGQASVEKFAAGLSDESLIALCVGNFRDDVSMDSAIGAAALDVAGAAGQTTSRTSEHGFDSRLVMADGPAGLRLCPAYRISGTAVIPTSQPLGEDLRELMGEEALPVPPEQKENVFYQNCTAIPIGTDVAQSFDIRTAQCFGAIVAEEMELFGVSLWLAPALNIQRSPLCGRNFEYYSEDPMLSGMIAAAVTKGVQSRPGCGVTVKHFACNNQETNRYTSNSVVSERALREIYLRGFERCIREARPRAVMSSYNLVNGQHTCNSHDLLTAVLRDEWGYRGIVMTDWMITTDFLAAPGSKYPVGSAAGCIRAGNDLIMPGLPTDLEGIRAALCRSDEADGVTRGDLQSCACRVLRLILDSVRPSVG